ncbi:MAG: DUF2971 domain-containing protein [Candidatus Cloacimonetes bacterium]|nr:DUF2971 domain-containing protein [Candidatus Cloacimonadota bacterium]
MNIDIKFFKDIYKEDVIYHYTKASTAIDFILYNEQLKFNEGRKSNDPIESRKARRGTVYMGSEVDEPITKENALDSNYLNKYISCLENQFHQICFCKNHIGKDFASEHYLCNFSGHEEIFGFTKFRMWEQYADNYAGVCIAFSKKKILALNDNKNNLLKDDIDYLTFRELSEKKMGDVNGNLLSSLGRDKYKEQIEENVKKSFFYKHKDYAGENEYRLGTLYDKKKCCVEHIRGELVFDKTMMLNVSGCIEAIFISSYLNDRQKKDLLEYANNLEVSIIEMNWKYDSFEPRDYRKRVALVDIMTKEIS